MESHSDPLRKIPTKHAPEAKADIGSALKAARAKKGASLDAVSQQTRISKKFLDALENNRFEEFPALAYLRGFLKGYCDYLEIDFDALWRQVLPEPAPAPAQGQPPAKTAAPAKPGAPGPSAPALPPSAKTPTPAPAPTLKGSPSLRSGEAQEPAHAPAPKPAHAQAPAPHAAAAPSHGHAAPSAHGGGDNGASGVVAGVLIAAGAGAILAGLFMFAPHQNVKLEKPSPAQQQPAPTPAALQPVKPPVEPQLTIAFRRDMWVSVSLDGVEKFQGRVPQGAKQSWKAKTVITLRASDPQALQMTLNGSAYALPAPDADGTFRIEAP